jgi:hypothetical protein
MKKLSNRHMNALKNTFPDFEIQKEVKPHNMEPIVNKLTN